MLVHSVVNYQIFVMQFALHDQVIFEGVYALHPEIRKSIDLWIAVVR